MEPRRSKHFLAHIPTIALLVLFAMSPWLGILFFILRAIDRDAEKKEQENAEYSSDFRPQDTGAGQPARDTEPVYGHDVPTAEQQNAKKRHKTLTSLCTVFGGIFLVVGLAGLADIIDMWGYWFDWGEFLTALAQTIGGGAALAMGLRMKQARKLERQLKLLLPQARVFPTHTNFVYLETQDAAQIYEYLKEQGIIIRLFGQNALRITASVDEELGALYAALEQMKEASK